MGAPEAGSSPELTLVPCCCSVLLEAASSSWLRSCWSSWWANRSSTMCRRFLSRESPLPCPGQCPETVGLGVSGRAAPSLQKKGGSALGHVPCGLCDTTQLSSLVPGPPLVGAGSPGSRALPTSALPVCSLCGQGFLQPLQPPRQHQREELGRPQASGTLTTGVPFPQYYPHWHHCGPHPATGPPSQARALAMDYLRLDPTWTPSHLPLHIWPPPDSMDSQGPHEP